MYKMFFPSGNAEEFCDHVFRTFDMDKNGYIDFKVSFLFYVRLSNEANEILMRPNLIENEVKNIFINDFSLHFKLLTQKNNPQDIPLKMSKEENFPFIYIFLENK